ncbi:hypothetical protein ACFX5K_06075 [Rickettsiales bacterium LUAb2]
MDTKEEFYACLREKGLIKERNNNSNCNCLIIDDLDAVIPEHHKLPGYLKELGFVLNNMEEIKDYLHNNPNYNIRDLNINNSMFILKDMSLEKADKMFKYKASSTLVGTPTPKYNEPQKLFLELEKQGKIIEVHNKLTKQINLSVNYDDAKAAYKTVIILDRKGVPTVLRLLDFKQDPIPKNTYSIPYNINLADYKKYYLPFVVSITSKDKNYEQRISLLTEIYKATTIINDLDDLSKIFNISLNNHRYKCQYIELLELKKTPGYIYKDTLD